MFYYNVTAISSVNYSTCCIHALVGAHIHTVHTSYGAPEIAGLGINISVSHELEQKGFWNSLLPQNCSKAVPLHSVTCVVDTNTINFKLSLSSRNTKNR